ncbi:MAG TPA: glucokinase, partial [Burkholderiales bacterium]|nr:glucokinase [Burkholderiales bacterium]
MSPAVVLGADVGGTNTKLAVARFESGAPVVIEREVYASADYAALELVIERFLRDSGAARYAPAIEAACFAVAGPVEHGRGRLTNLPWQPDESEIAKRFAIPRVRVINDFAAAGRGVAYLAADDLLTLQAGTPEERGERVVVGAGTGLGVALLDWDGDAYEVHPSEAGHADFAPVDAVQDRLLQHLRKEFPRVSYERVVCGAGFGRILAFLEAIGAGEPSQTLKDAVRAGKAASAITELGLTKKDPLAALALDIFAAAYGSFTGNMALTMLAHGG